MAKEEGTGKSLSPDPAPFKLMYDCVMLQKKRKGCNQVFQFFYLFNSARSATIWFYSGELTGIFV